MSRTPPMSRRKISPSSFTSARTAKSFRSPFSRVNTRTSRKSMELTWWLPSFCRQPPPPGSSRFFCRIDLALGDGPGHIGNAQLEKVPVLLPLPKNVVPVVRVAVELPGGFDNEFIQEIRAFFLGNQDRRPGQEGD